MEFEQILEDGIIKYKTKYVKIIKVLPVNFDLKSELEKKAILNSYKLFLKACNFNIQILIQNKKQNLLNHISKIQKIQEENPKIIDIKSNYIDFLKEKNIENNSSLKNFYIVIDYNFSSISDKRTNSSLDIVKSLLSENFFKIKESLSRCGNVVYDISNKEEIIDILKSFYNLEN